MAPPTKGSNGDWDDEVPDAKRLLAEKAYEDCFACKATGSAAFVGLGLYSYHTGMKNLRLQENAIMKGPTKYKMGSRRLGIATISAALVGMGVLRAFV
ncbi:hypothetical protein BJX99DRAFT_226770 [Aspergillus californicus]